MPQLKTRFGRAELSDADALLFVDTGRESLSLNASVSDGELLVKLYSGERELYDGSAYALEADHEFTTAAKRLRGYEPLLTFLSGHKAHPDMEAMLHYLRIE